MTDAEIVASSGGTAAQYNIFLSNGTSAGATPSHGTLSDARANMAIGASALAALTQGDYNLALGYRALVGVTTGDSNIAMGYNTGVALSTTDGNVLVGFGAGEATTSKYQVAIGHAALGSGAGGDENVAIGHSALLNCANKFNIGIGLRAGGQITSGVGNISMGYNTMYGSNYTGSYNIIMGYNQDPSTTSISREFTVGMNGTEILMRGTYATAGQCKLLINAAGTDVPTATLHVKGAGTTTLSSVLVESSTGTDLLDIKDSGDAYVLTDLQPKMLAYASDVADRFSIMIGNNTTMTGRATHGTLSGNHRSNYGIGAHVLKSVTSGSYNVGMGYACLNALTTSDYNICIGYASYTGSGGGSNVVLGANAYTNGTGSFNLVMGVGAKAAGSGDYNVVLGATGAGSSSSTGHSSVMVGANTAPVWTSGYWNTCVGRQAGLGLTTGHYNVAIGSQTTLDATGANQICIGNLETTTAADQINIGGNIIGSRTAADRYTTFIGQAYSPTSTLTSSASITPNFKFGNTFKVTLAHSGALANPINPKDGATYTIIVTQDGTGSRTMSFGANYKWAGGTAPTLSTAAGAVDILTFISDGTNMYGTSNLNFS